MGVKERIMSIRLCEKMAKRPQVAAAMNVEFVQEKEVLKDKKSLHNEAVCALYVRNQKGD